MKAVSIRLHLSLAMYLAIALLLACSLLISPDAFAATNPGLVAAYSFDEGSGTVVNDLSGNGHNGSISNATWTTQGHSLGALSFNGTNALVSIADAPDLRLSTAMTLEAWVNPAALSGWRTVVLKERPSGLSYSLYGTDNTNRPPAVYGNTGGNDVAAAGATLLPLNAWSHLAGTYDGTALRLYVNGTLVRSQALSGTLVASTSPLRIGGNAVWGEYFSGLIDDVRVYARALSSAEITADMNSPVTVDTVSPTVSVTNPVDGATVSGIVSVTANASDNVGVAGVQFLLDGTALGAEIATAPYTTSWDTTTTTTGTHTLAARARDTAGNTATSATITITVAASSDTVPPMVSITAPTDGATVSGSVSVTANASDNQGVYSVQFLLDGSPIGAAITAAPYVLTWDSTKTSNGSHTLSAKATDTGGNIAESASVSVTVSNSDPRASTGEWAAPISLPNIMQHAILLPGSSKILYFEDGAGARVLDVNSGSVTSVPVASDLFCAGHAFLPDGRPIVIGGDTATIGTGIIDTNLFDPTTNSWNRVADMHFPRWYPTATTLADGRVLALSGSNGCPSCIIQTPEIYDATTNSWTTLPAANANIPYYPFVYLLPDGRLVQVGATETPTTTQVLDLQTQTWSTVDSRAIDAGSSTMYRPGKILKGGTASDGNTAVRPASPNTYVLDMTASSPAWRQVGSMANPRAFLNFTTLPDGTVLVTGGETTADGTNVANAVYAAELWSPVTEQWTTLASSQIPRLYHSTALLLPDARVLIGGSGNDGAVPNELSYEIFSPPYLFKGPRPTISSAPASITYGQSFAVGTPDAARIGSAVMMAPAAVTHSFDENARFVPLTFTAGAGELQVQAPANGNLAPLGYYMLFLVDSTGVPSTAAWIRVQVPQDTTQPAVAITAPAQGATVTGSVNVTANASDNVGVTSVQFLLDNVALGSPDTSAPYSVTWDSTMAANGQHVLSARAFDAAGNVGTAANVTVTVSNTASSGLNMDKVIFKDGRGNITTPAFSTVGPNELLLAFVASDGPTSGGQSVTVSGAGLSWTLVQRTNTRLGTAEVWKAFASNALTNVTVQSGQTKGSYDQSITVAAITGASGVGASAGASGQSGTPSVTLVTTAANAWVFAVGNDWDKAIGRTLGTGQTMVHQWVDTSSGDTMWVQRLNGAVAAQGTTVTINDTAPTTDQWNFTAVEIRP